MSKTTLIGTAHVNVRAISTKLKDDIAKGLGSGQPNGTKFGKEFATGFKAGIGNLSTSIRFGSGRAAGTIYAKQFGSGFQAGIGDLGRNIRVGSGRAAGTLYGQQFAAGFKASAKLDVGGAGVGSVAGAKFGKEFKTGFKTGIGNLSTEINRSIGSGRAKGILYGKQFAAGFRIGTAGLGGGLPDPDPGGNAGGASGRRSGSSFGKEFGRGLSSLGDSPLSSLITQGQLMGGALISALGAVSALVGGLVALAGAAAQAAGAIVVLPMAMGAAAQAGLTLMVALKGVGEALKLGKAAKEATGAGKAVVASSKAVANSGKAVESSQRAVAAAMRAVRDATQGVGKAHREAGEAAIDAARQTERAERSLTDAILAELDAQRALNGAREEAAESLQQLQFSAEDAALAQERAALDLIDARAAMAGVANLPVDDRARVEAELALKEADLNYRQATDRVGDLGVAQERAAAAGIEGSEQVIDAQDNIADAQQNVLDQTRELQEARENEGRVAVENAERIRDANERLADSLDRLAEAQGQLADARKGTTAAQNAGNAAVAAGVTDLDKYDTALKKLPPSAQELVKAMLDINSEFLDLRDIASENTLPAITRNLKLVTQNAGIIETLGTMFKGTGIAISGVVDRLGAVVTKTSFLDNMGQIFSDNSDFIRTAGNALTMFVEALAVVGAAAGGLFRTFGVFLQREARQFLDFVSSAEGNKKLVEFFDKAQIAAAAFGGLFSSTFALVSTILQGGSDTGLGFVDSLTKAADKMNTFLKSTEGNKQLKEFFADIDRNVRSITKVLGPVGEEFLKLGTAPEVGKFADTLETGLVPLLPTLREGAEASGPAVATLAVSVADIIATFTETGAMTTFIDTLTTLVDVFGDLTGALPPGLLTKLIVFFGIYKGIALFGKFTGLFTFIGALGGIAKAMVGAVWSLAKGIWSMGAWVVANIRAGTFTIAMQLKLLALSGAFNGTAIASKAAWLSVLGPAAIVIAIIAAVALGVFLLYKRFAGVRKVVDAFGKFFVTAFHVIVDGAKMLWDMLFGHSIIPDIINGFKEWFGKIVGFIKPPLEAIWKVIKVVFDVVKFIILTYVKVYLLIITTYIKLWIGVFKIAFALLKAIFNNVLKPIFNIIVDVIKGAIDAAIVIWNTLSAAISWVFENLIKPAINAGIGVFMLLKAGVQTAINGVIAVWDTLGIAWTWVVDNIITPVVDFLIGRFENFKNNIGKIVDWVKKKWDAFGAAVQWVIDKIVTPIVVFLIGRFENFKRNLGIIVDWIKAKWNLFGALIKLVINEVIIPIVQKVKDKFEEFKRGIGIVVDWIKSKWEAFGTGLGTIYDKFIKPSIDKVKSAFEAIKTKASEVIDGVKAIFKKLTDAPKDGIIGLINLLNKYLIGNINKMGKVFGFEIPDIPVPEFAKGGYVRGRGGTKGDKIHARLSDREFVVNAAATARNRPLLEAINAGRGRVHTSVAPVGGWNPFADIKEGVMGALGAGLGKALEELVNPFVEDLVPEDTFAGKFFRSIVPAMIEKMKSWGEKKETSVDSEGAMLGAGRTGAYGGVMPWVAAAGDLIKRVFGVTDIGGVGGRGNKSDHPTGHALDFMTYQNRLLGYQIVAYMMALRDKLKLTYLIFYDRIASASQGWKWRPYTHPNGPTSNATLRHLDHVHASFSHRPGVWRGKELAMGGIVHPQPGGVMARIAEAGRPERVEPLDRNGLSRRDSAIVSALDRLSVMANGGDTYQINASPGMDIAELSAMISRRQAFKKRKGVS